MPQPSLESAPKKLPRLHEKAPLAVGVAAVNTRKYPVRGDSKMPALS